MDICMICKSSKKDDIQYGEFLKNKQFGVHTFCLYLSSNLSQYGRDDEGFLGFLPRDIKAEVRRISLLKCCYCNKKYANIGCCNIKCRNCFHLICGLENKAENTFCGDFRSYCHKHVRKVAERPSSAETCLICFDRLFAPGEKFNGVDVIMTPCCRNGWFHRICLQKFAKTAGYFFKCPLCNDDNVFREQLPAKGIFIPNQDAAWELEPNAYAELLERPSICAAQQCKNRKGRSDKCKYNPFVYCNTCGSIAVHKYCLPKGGTYFNCTDCSVAVEERDSGHESINSYANQNDDEYIDVCHVSDKEDIATSNIMTENKSYDTKISDEGTARTIKNWCHAKINDEHKSSSDTDNDDVKPCASNRKARLRLESESSEILQKAYNINKETRHRTRIDAAFENEKTSRTNEKCSYTTNSENQNSSSDTDNGDPKPCATKQTARLRLESESSETSQKPYNNSKETRFRTRKDAAFENEKTIRTKQKCSYTTSRETQNSSSDTDNGDPKPCATKQTARLRLESESSETSQKAYNNSKETRFRTRKGAAFENEKTSRTKEKCSYTTSSETQNSSSEPCATKQTARLRLESESSDTSQKAYNNSKETRFRTRKDAAFENEKTIRTKQKCSYTTSRETQNSSSDTNNRYPKPCASKQTARLRLESESSDTSQKAYSNCNRTRCRMKKDTAFGDEKTSHTKKKRRHTTNFKEQISNSDTDNEDVVPCTTKQTARLRLESESSETSQEAKSSSNKTGFRTKKCRNPRSCKEHKSSSDTDNDNDDIKPCLSKQTARLRIESGSSVSSQEAKSSTKKIEFGIETENSSNRDIIKQTESGRKRKGSYISLDSEDEIPSPKQNCLISKGINKENVHNTNQRAFNNIYEGNDSDSDTDPLQHFFKIFEKSKVVSKQTKTLTTDKQEVRNSQAATTNICKQTENKFVDLEKKRNNSAQSLTFFGVSNDKAAEKKQSENPLNVSCIASRTRRRTVCGRTDFDKQKHELPQVFERLHESNESLDHLTGIDGCSEEKSDASVIFVQDNDDYTESGRKFDISCIANRTRRRTTLKCQRLSKIIEISESSSDSNMSVESLSKSNNLGALRNRRLNSDASEGFVGTTSSTLANTSSLKLEKYPLQNFNKILTANSKKAESANSNPAFTCRLSNAHHLHSSNRNRI